MKKAIKSIECEELFAFSQVLQELDNHSKAMGIVFDRIIESEETKVDVDVERLICTTVALIFTKQAEANRNLLDKIIRCYEKEINKKSEEK